MKKHYMKKGLVSFLAISLLISGCREYKDGFYVIPSGPASLMTLTYKFDSESNSSLMFQDGESMDVLTSEARRYEIGKVLRVKAVDATTIEVANFAPVDISDATILMTIAGQPKTIKLFNIKKIRAHAVKVIKYPFIDGYPKFLATDDSKVDLTFYKKGIAANTVSFDFTGNTDLIKKLKSLAKLKWQIGYLDYDPNDDPNNNWKDNIGPKDVRRYTGLMINYAYCLQADTALTAFLAEPITNNNGILMTTAKKQEVFNSILRACS